MELESEKSNREIQQGWINERDGSPPLRAYADFRGEVWDSTTYNTDLVSLIISLSCAAA